MDKIINSVKAKIDTPVGDFNIQGAVTKEPVPFENRKKLEYRKYEIGDSWGELFDCAWFHLTGRIDPSVTEPVYLKLDMNCEALLFNKRGIPVKGFTNGSSNFGSMGKLGSPAKCYYPLKDFTTTEGEVDLWLDAGMNDLFGKVKNEGRIETIQMVNRNLSLRELYYDLTSLTSLKQISLKNDKEAFKIYRKGLKQVSMIIRKEEKNWVESARAVTASLLNTETNAKHEISAIGHAHLDLAWLWPIRETYRKGARTFANVLRLMEQYEDFKFGASQPQLYQWIKEQQPQLYEEVLERIKEGRWEVQGGMWVEADTNVSGEEALIRQMLYGINFFKEEFGIRVKSLWLPDVFGYSGNMPQIIRKSGLDYFMTIKLSWNDTNQFPYHSFNWQGIDGSKVLAHMPPEGEYNSPANAQYLFKSMENFKEKKISNQTLSLFGVGDGGGGPSPSHIERIRRLDGIAPMAKVIMETSNNFFEKINQLKDKFPTFCGELYLEKHRGTYTSQGNVKYYNRKMEQKLKTFETLLVQLGQYSNYKPAVKKIWQEVLLYQFHDILPGSSIKRVYDECLARYEILDKQINEIISEILKARLIKENEPVEVESVQIYNPLPVEVLLSHISENHYHQFNVAPLSGKINRTQSWKKTIKDDDRALENKLIKIEFSKDGSISSIFDKQNGIKILKSAGNHLRVYTDTADAWDISRYYRFQRSSKMSLYKTEAYSYGPVGEIVQYYKFGKNRIIQKIRLKPDSRRIDFDISAQWKSLHTMLRTSFPLNLKTDKAVFDIQFGHLYRSTKNATKKEKAQYEVCGQNWVDMNNGTWGAALITDCKYGFRAKGSTLDLNLIKSTNYPAKSGDLGSHKISFGLYIHNGDHIEGKVDGEAMEFNSWFPFYTGSGETGEALFKLSTDNITYSTVKESEDGKNLIMRLYERNGLEADTTLTINRAVDSIYTTNMVEENPIKITDSSEVQLHFTPFEVKTLKIVESKVF